IFFRMNQLYYDVPINLLASNISYKACCLFPLLAIANTKKKCCLSRDANFMPLIENSLICGMDKYRLNVDVNQAIDEGMKGIEGANAGIEPIDLTAEFSTLNKFETWATVAGVAHNAHMLGAVAILPPVIGALQTSHRLENHIWLGVNWGLFINITID
ncbi:hypothetical protein ACJX0J_006103, partial [Zea mays]